MRPLDGIEHTMKTTSYSQLRADAGLRPLLSGGQSANGALRPLDTSAVGRNANAVVSPARQSSKWQSLRRHSSQS